MKSLVKMLKKRKLKKAFIHILVFFHSKLRVNLYKYFLSDNKPLLINSKILQPTQFIGLGEIKLLGANLGVWPSPGLVNNCGYIEARSETANIVINQSTFLNNNFVIIADRTIIEIGCRCLIGSNFFITDSDFHGLEVANRSNGFYECAPVVIKDDVFIGDSVKVLKGVVIGEGAVIGSGSIVVNDVAPYSVYAGVPAKKIRDLSSI